MGPNPNGPRSVSCDRAIRYSGLFGVRSVGPVGDFLDIFDIEMLDFLSDVSSCGHGAHRIHGTSLVYLPDMDSVDFYGKFVGKYTVRPMDPMGRC